MAVFDFTVTGQIEVDGDALGVAVANSIRTQPGDLGEIDVDFGFKYRLDPAAALGILLQQGIAGVMNDRLGHVGWRPNKLDATAEEVQQ